MLFKKAINILKLKEVCDYLAWSSAKQGLETLPLAHGWMLLCL